MHIFPYFCLESNTISLALPFRLHMTRYPPSLLWLAWLVWRVWLIPNAGYSPFKVRKGQG